MSDYRELLRIIWISIAWLYLLAELSWAGLP